MNKFIFSIFLLSLLHCNIDSTFGRNLNSLHKSFMYKWEGKTVPENKIQAMLIDKNFIEKDWENYIFYKVNNERKENQNRIWIRIPLYDNSKQYSEYIFIPNIIEIFEVYLDDKKIYSTGDVSNAQGEMFYGLEWHLIRLPNTLSNKYIYIRIYSSNKNYIGLHHDIKIGLKESIIYWMLSRNKSEIIMSIMSIILSLLFIISAFFLKPINKLDFYIFSLLSLLIGVYFINQIDSVQFVIHAPMIRPIVREVILVLIPITSILLYNNIYENNKILNSLIILFIIYLITKYIFIGYSFFNNWTYTLSKLVILTYFILGSFIIKKAIWKDVDAILLFFGFVSLSIPVMSELLNYDFQYIRMVRVKHSIFILNLLCGFVCFRKYIYLQNEELQKKFLDEQNQRIKSELEYLHFKNKINRVIPHYLYNTLSYVLNNKNNQKMVEKSVKYLCDYYRNLIELSDGNNLTKIEDELNFTKEFLEFQSERFAKKLRFSIKKKLNLNESLLIPLLSIQSLADNAYKHGIRNSKRKGKIEIYLENYADGCKIIVEDNGIGLKDNFVKSKTLTNIEIHAKLIYDEVSVKIESIFRNNKKFGTRVELIFYSQKTNYLNSLMK